MTGTCGTCANWDPAHSSDRRPFERIRYGHKMGMGLCNNVPAYYDATVEPKSDNPADQSFEARVLKPEFQSAKALAVDGSGYVAMLITAPDFGCTCFTPKV